MDCLFSCHGLFLSFYKYQPASLFPFLFKPLFVSTLESILHLHSTTTRSYHLQQLFDLIIFINLNTYNNNGSRYEYGLWHGGNGHDWNHDHGDASCHHQRRHGHGRTRNGQWLQDLRKSTNPFAIPLSPE